MAARYSHGDQRQNPMHMIATQKDQSHMIGIPGILSEISAIIWIENKIVIQRGGSRGIDWLRHVLVRRMWKDHRSDRGERHDQGDDERFHSTHLPKLALKDSPRSSFDPVCKDRNACHLRSYHEQQEKGRKQ